MIALSTLIIAFSATTSFSSGLAAAFVLGLVFDLWQGVRFGTFGITFLVLSFFVNVYKRKYNADNVIFLIPFSAVSVFAIYTAFARASLSISWCLFVIVKTIGFVVVWIAISRLWKGRYLGKKENN